MDVLDTGNENEAKLIRLDPIMISIGTSRGANGESALVIIFHIL
jgi:hypothetical protein